MMLKKLIRNAVLLVKHRKTNQIKTYETLSISCDISHSALQKHVMVASRASVAHSKVDDFSSVGRNSKITHSNIGKYCAISWDVTINALSHPYTHLSISAFPYVPYVGNFVKKRMQNYEEVVIGNDVWVGANSVIMPGVTIGNGAIVGAGAVVTKDVPDYAIVAGVPAKMMKYRFEKTMIEKLLELKWWDLPEDIIKENIHLWQGG